ncbi:hypothetical protein RND71_044035 [Anisodus tanguticus]|uniref:40S ribosomal protein S3a n=1 Tax=Anisodus tanguticus TaxID=243964 RepID=A0AAE1QPJ0_9SOLA|nr:hypothetical protein RND71_044035 [Anisodus tanguticus]
MAKGQKSGQKGAKKGQKKKIIDPFSRKEWYDVRAPAMFKVRNIGKTLVNRSVANKLASDSLKGRVFECSLADLQNDEIAYRKFKLVAEDVQGKNLLTNFHGMNLTTDAFAHVIEKRCAKVYPLHDVMIRKVKVMKKPKVDMARLLEMHDETRTTAIDSTGAPAEGVKVDRPDGYEPPVLSNV